MGVAAREAVANILRMLTAAILVSISAASVIAQTPIVEWEKRQDSEHRLTAFGDDMFGDGIDPHTGAISFTQTDISIPGNSGIPVELVRKRSQGHLYGSGANAEFGDWEFVVPRIKVTTLGTRPWDGQRCSQAYSTHFTSFTYSGQIIRSNQYSNGVTVEVGGSSEQLLESPSGAQWPAGATHATRDNWYFTCGSALDGGQGFIGHAPNGLTYRFDKVINLDAGLLKNYGPTNVFSRTTTILAATEVSDPFGNWVRYVYSGNRLTRIHSNDLREITLSYLSGTDLVQSASAHGRTWSYSYADKTMEYRYSFQPIFGWTGKMLQSVTQPDGRAWQFDLEELSNDVAPGVQYCPPDITYSLSVTHPYGATASFQLEDLPHRYSMGGSVPTPPFCSVDTFDPGGPGATWPLANTGATRTLSVKSKTVSGPSIPTSVWTYAYESDTTINTASDNYTNWTTVSGPGLHITYRHRWNGDGPDNLKGVLVSKEVRATAGGALLERVEYDYTLEGGFGATSMSGLPQPKPNQTQPVRTTEIETARGPDLYTKTLTYDLNQSSSGYSFGKPTQTVETGVNTLTSRVTDQTYEHKKPVWVIGLPDVTTRNGKVFENHDYNSNGQRTRTWKFGAFYADYEYDSAGNLDLLENALGYKTEFTSYKRGQPQSIKLRDGNYILRVIDDFGQITSETNPRNITFGYTYNNMGWITSVNRPGSWADSNISYAVGANGVTQTATRGTKREIVTYDNMLRPTVIQQQAVSGGGGPIYNTVDYDELGRTVFESWPSATANPTAGVDTTYDALGRITQTQETVSPNATTLFDYEINNKIKVTDPSGAYKTTTYRAYGAPETNEVVEIFDEMGATTVFERNVYGNVTHIDQPENVDRYFWYDDRLCLCRHRAPEFGGDELFSYDGLDRLTAASRGEAASSGCGTPTNPLGVFYQYDSMDRQRFVSFGDGVTPPFWKHYDANGNLTDVDRQGAAWDYTYNELDLLDSETVLNNGVSYSVTHGYNTSGFVATRTLPDGTFIEFYPNGLGQPTAVISGSKRYVVNAVYHPNGLPFGAMYDNGASLTQTLNSRQLPFELKVIKGGSLVHLRYDYDVRRKITGITDFVVGGQNRTFGYDAKGRLDVANGPWGAGSFAYNDVDNILSKQLGSRTVSLTYDGQNRVSQVTDGAGGGTQTWNYDARGNVIANGANALTYDQANQPVTITASGVSQTHTYDGNLKRLKTVEGNKTTDWFYSALTGTPIYQKETENGVSTITHYITVGGVTVRLKNGIEEYTHNDHQGSPVAATDSMGNVAWREAYTPFGEKWQSAPANDNDIGYTGHVMDAATGLTYMQARYYDPVAARFLSTDPIGYRDQLNLYAYVGNDPVNKTDPTGEYASSLPPGAIEAAIKLSGSQRPPAPGSNSPKGFPFKLGLKGGLVGFALGQNWDRSRRQSALTVYRVHDQGLNASPNGRSWTIEDPSKMEDWRDRLAVYPKWNAGTHYDEGKVSFEDFENGNIMPSGNPGSIAGPQPYDENLGGGPYSGAGNEIIINAPFGTVKDRVTHEMPTTGSHLKK